MAHIVDLHAYGVTAERGFLPIADPNAAIPLANAEWHETARNLPSLIPSGKIRAIIERLPEFRPELLSSEEDLEAAFAPFGQVMAALIENVGNAFAHVYMVRAEEKLRALAADEESASLLNVAPGTPLLSVERIAYTYNDAPMELRRGLYRTDAHHYHNTLS